MKCIHRAALRAVVCAAAIAIILPGLSKPLFSSSVTVTIAPKIVPVSSGDTVQYQATVLNTSNKAVQWGSCDGRITSSGLFTAPVVTQTQMVCVWAVSLADSSKSTATFAAVSPGPAPAEGKAVVPLDENAYCAKGDIWTGAASDGSAHLPQACVYTGLDGSPSPGKVTVVGAGGDVQAAVNAASCGDMIELQEGATFTLKAAPVFPSKNCDANHWITIRTTAPDSSLPPEHIRINPSYAGVASLAGRPAFSGPKLDVMAKLVVPASPIQIGDHYRLIGLEITRPDDGKWYNALLAPAGSHIIVDRNWIHGDPKAETTHLVQIQHGTNHFALINSYLTDAHCTAATGACVDAQALADAGYGTVMKAYNNFLEASTENILFGGSVAEKITSDVEIRENHLFKPFTWNPRDRKFGGRKFVVKNHFEVKEGARILFEGNVLENTWGGFSQMGASILLTPKNQSGGKGSNLCPICYVSDVTLRYNYVRHAAQALVVANGPSDNGGWSLGASNYSIHDMIFDGMQYAECSVCASFTTQIGNFYDPASPPPSVMHNVTLSHITILTNGTWSPGTSVNGFLNMSGVPAVNPTNTPQMSNIQFVNSIFDVGNSATYPTGGGANNCAVGQNTQAATFAACWVGKSAFTGNVMVEDATSTNFFFPAGNHATSSWNQVQFLNFGSGDGGD